MRCLFLLLAPALLLAEEPASTKVKVVGEATVVRPATEARIFLRVTGQAEDAKEAKVKHKERAQKILEALKKAGVAEGDVFRHAPSVMSGQSDNGAAAQAMMRGGRGDQTSAMVSIASAIEVRIPPSGNAAATEPGASGNAAPPDPGAAIFERATALLDALLEAGADNISADQRQYAANQSLDTTGPASPFIVFVAADGQAIKEEAYEKAVAAARAQATTFATKLGLKVGKVTAVEEESAGSANNQDVLAAMFDQCLRLSAEGPWKLAAASAGVRPSITHSVRLDVEFALVP